MSVRAATRQGTGSGPLASIQVVDLTTQIAGPYCTKLFADAGADVVKVEPVGGDPMRTHSLSGRTTGPEGGPLFRHLNGGKRSIVGDLSDPLVAALLPGTDLVVEDSPDGDVVDRLRASHPHLVVVSITPFGRTGPLSGAPASDLTIQAESGGMKFRGRPDRPPIQAGGRISEFLGGTAAAAPALAAVLRSRHTGLGEHVDVSIHDVMAIAGSNYMDLLDSLMGRPALERPLRILDTPGIEQTADGIRRREREHRPHVRDVPAPDRTPRPARRSRRGSARTTGSRWVTTGRSTVDAWMSTRTTEEVVDAAAELRIPVAPVHDGRSVVGDEQYAAREHVRAAGSTVDPDPGAVPRGRPPTPGTPCSPPRRASRRVHDRDPTPRPASIRTAAGGLPLRGLKVVDHTSWWVGGMATQVLALLGADVIHVESASHPDGMRLTGAWSGADDWWEYGHMFTAANAGKRGVTLDLGHNDGRGSCCASSRTPTSTSRTSRPGSPSPSASISTGSGP